MYVRVLVQFMLVSWYGHVTGFLGGLKMATVEKIELRCSTKPRGCTTGTVGKKTVLTVELDDNKALQAFAARGIVVAWQAIARMADSYPATDTVKISELVKRGARGGFKSTPSSMANRINQLPEVEYRATLRNLGMDEKTIDKMVLTAKK